MRRRIFLFLGILTLLAAGLAVDEFKFPVKSGSVRFAAIGDMGTGESPQYEVAQHILEFQQKYLGGLRPAGPGAFTPSG